MTVDAETHLNVVRRVLSDQWPFGDLLRHAYRIILMDAPTKFASGPNRNPINHYKTMTIAEIAAMPVGDLAFLRLPPDPGVTGRICTVSRVACGMGLRYCTGRQWLKTSAEGRRTDPLSGLPCRRLRL